MRLRNVTIALVALVIPVAASMGSENAESSRSIATDGTGRSCADIADDAERLACYDTSELREQRAAETFLERHWDLEGRGRLFQPWAHRPNYMLPARWTSSPNKEPFEELADALDESEEDVQAIETKFQISFKTKLVEELFGGPGDLWFGYTQQSHFQVYNAGVSRAFRETNFQPEAIVSFPIRRTWGQWTWRVVGAGLTHQSNGRSELISRSWNRIYAFAGIERKRLSFHLRPWIRIDSNDPDDDDNPDIEDLVGRFEALAVWQPRSHVLSVRGRSNLKADGHKGSLQVDWYFPIAQRIRGQVQAFSGYGESLIDYDHNQTTLGIGILLFDPF